MLDEEESLQSDTEWQCSSATSEDSDVPENPRINTRTNTLRKSHMTMVDELQSVMFDDNACV